MDDPITYNIPATMIEAYRGRNIIVRSDHLSEAAALISEEALSNLAYIQLLSLDVAAGEMIHWAEGAPLDFVMKDPATEFPLLYNFAELLETHPVRATIPIAPGCDKAVKLASSLNYSVKLEMTEPPNASSIEEMAQVLDSYLHRSTLSQPVEYFHSSFMSFFHGGRTTLWEIQEEDPARIRYVTDEGRETISRRFATADLKGDAVSFVAAFQEELLSEKRECYGCEFLDNCGGYFKWPHKEYDCEGVKRLFQTLKEAAGELQSDLEAYRQSQGDNQS